jgi:hypothetical protein
MSAFRRPSGDSSFAARALLIEALDRPKPTLHRLDQEKRGLEILHTAENKIHERGVGDPEAIYKIAQAYGLLGDRASALRVLQHSIETGSFSSLLRTSRTILSYTSFVGTGNLIE